MKKEYAGVSEDRCQKLKCMFKAKPEVLVKGEDNILLLHGDDVQYHSVSERSNKIKFTEN